MGSRGAAVECVSAIDIALWDIRGKALGKPIYELLGGPVRDEIALYTHPDQRKFTSKEGVIAEIKDIVALRPHRAQIRSLPLSGSACGRPGPRAARRLSRRVNDAQGRARGRRTDRADPRDRGPGHRNPHRRAWPLRRPDRDPALPHAGGSRPDRLVRGAGAARELQRAQAGARQGQCADLLGRARPHEMGFRADPREQARRLHHARRDLDRRHHRAQEDLGPVRGVLHSGVSARRCRPDQRRRRGAGDDDGAELLQARDLGVEPPQIRRAHRQAARQFERQPQAQQDARARDRNEPRLSRGKQVETSPPPPSEHAQLLPEAP